MNNSNSRTIFALVKFFEKKEYLNDFLNGTLYMNTVGFFQKEDEDNDNSSVYDKYEGTSVHWQPNQVEMQFNDIVITPNDLAGPIVIQTKAFDNFNIFCMYAISSGNFKELNDDNYEEFINSLRMDEKNSEFGKFCVIVNYSTFLERVKQAVIKNNFYMKANLIDYYNVDEFTGSFSGIEALFHKKSQFAYQNEYRIVIDNKIKDNQAYCFEIGDISDICSISSIDEINKAEWSFKKIAE